MSAQENILGSMPMNRLVFHMSWPIMLSMLTQAIYNLIDSIYVAQLSDAAFLALSYAFPVQSLLTAFCVGIGVGFSALLGKRLGEQNLDRANQVILHGFLLYFLCWLLFLLFGLSACHFYLEACTQRDQVIRLGKEYLQIICVFSAGVCIQFPCERILQSTGYPAGFMIVQGSGALINLILDPILIFAFDLGVAGAAIATVTGQIIGGLIGVFLLYRIRNELPLSFSCFRFSPPLVKEMAQIAVPAVFMQSLSSIMSFGLNAILNLWCETAVWVLGVYFKLQTFVFMPIFSISNGMISIISFNYGAKAKNRISEAVRFGLTAATSTALLGALLLWCCAAPLLTHCFQAGTLALELGVPTLRMTALAFPVAAISLVLSSVFQALGRSAHSLYIALLRQIILLLPITALLVRYLPQWTFLSFLAAELLSCAATIILYRKLHRDCIQSIK